MAFQFVECLDRPLSRPRVSGLVSNPNLAASSAPAGRRERTEEPIATTGVRPVAGAPCSRSAQVGGVFCVEPAGTSIVTVIVSGSSRRWVAHFWR